MILEQMQALAEQAGGTVDMDEELLEGLPVPFHCLAVQSPDVLRCRCAL